MLNVRLLSLTITGLLMLLLAGCLPSSMTNDDTELLKKPVPKWTAQECEKFLIDQTISNAHRNDQDILAFVFPCTPKMLQVYNWRRYRMHSISREEYVANTDRQARTCLGAYYNGDNDRFLDHQGEYLKTPTQLDSIMVIITLESRSSGINPFLRGIFRNDLGSDNNVMSLFMNPAFNPNLYPEFNSLRDKITIEGNQEYLSSPTYVRTGGGQNGGNKGDLLVMFPVTDGMRRYLENHSTVEIKIEVGRNPIRLDMPIYM